MAAGPPPKVVTTQTPTSTGGTLSYAQLKGVWLKAAKGTRYDSNTWASLMAAIAEAESAGDPLATNPTDNNGTQTSWGLWQISNGTHSEPATNWGDPEENARLAIQKLDTQGLGAWGTYDSGAYKAYLSDKTAADLTAFVIPSTVQQAGATASAKTQTNCAWSLGSWDPSIFGYHPVGTVSYCVLSKSQARAVLGASMLLLGTLMITIGADWMLVAAGLRVAAPLAAVAAKAAPEGAAASTAAKGAAAEGAAAA